MQEPMGNMFRDKAYALSVFREKISELFTHLFKKVEKEKGWRIKPARNFDFMF